MTRRDEWLESSIRYLVSEAGSGRRGQSGTALENGGGALHRDVPPIYGGGCRRSRPAGSRAHAMRSSAVARLMHRQPFRHWIVAELAEEVGTSQSVVCRAICAASWRGAAGLLARWRLQLAARMLQTTREFVLQVASEVGYDLEAAFNRAFKREFGIPPGKFRRLIPRSHLGARH